ncbi:unnamed protein product [Phytophthora fragariaefolia]|uniref:Unnamed protein product n=1 Tax=Phytophthora fragariaefolia TaxID=1490495 RepID=A0A9W6XF42_9STRA|nr:unnamed protein product [Phytophthora fragariaefolia]
MHVGRSCGKVAARITNTHAPPLGTAVFLRRNRCPEQPDTTAANISPARLVIRDPFQSPFGSIKLKVSATQSTIAMGSSATFIAAETPKGGETNRLDVAFNRVENPTPTSSKDKVATDGQMVSMAELFSYADGIDKLLMLLGTVGGLTAGVGQPIQIVLFGDVLNTFNPADPGANIEHSIRHVALNFVYVGIAVFIAGSFQVACWTITASRQAKRIRSEYVSAIMTKEIGWFDVNEPMQLGSRVAEATVIIQQVCPCWCVADEGLVN